MLASIYLAVAVPDFAVSPGRMSIPNVSPELRNSLPNKAPTDSSSEATAVKPIFLHFNGTSHILPSRSRRSTVSSCFLRQKSLPSLASERVVHSPRKPKHEFSQFFLPANEPSSASERLVYRIFESLTLRFFVKN